MLRQSKDFRTLVQILPTVGKYCKHGRKHGTDAALFAFQKHRRIITLIVKMLYKNCLIFCTGEALLGAFKRWYSVQSCTSITCSSENAWFTMHFSSYFQESCCKWVRAASARHFLDITYCVGHGALRHAQVYSYLRPFKKASSCTNK